MTQSLPNPEELPQEPANVSEEFLTSDQAQEVQTELAEIDDEDTVVQ